MNFFALVAFYFLFAVVIFVSNVILAVNVIAGRLVKQRSFLLLLNFAAADVIYALTFFVQTLGLLGIPVVSTQTDLSALQTISILVTSVVQVNLVVVNVSYVLETRKEHALLHGSRLVAALMVASPWLYALLVVTPFFASPLGYTISQAGVGRYPTLNTAVGALMIQHIIPGFFACIATALAVVSYVTRDRQEGSVLASSTGDVTPMLNMASTQWGGNSSQLQDVTSAVPGSAGDVTAEPRPPKAEVVYTCLSVGLLQLTIYVMLGVTVSPIYSLGDMLTVQNGLLAAAFISFLRPALFCWLWKLRPEYQPLCCGHRRGARYS